MTPTSPTTAERIAQQGKLELLARLRTAFGEQAQHSAGAARLDPDELECLVAEAAGRADGALWRRSLAEAAMSELGIDLAAAVEHPEVLRAHELVGAPPYEPPVAPVAESEPPVGPATEPELPVGPVAESELPVGPATEPELPPEPAAEAEPEPGREAVRIAAVHSSGIESLRAGEPDIELLFSDAGLDVLKRSTGAAIGRLEWSEIHSVKLLPPRRGLGVGRRKARTLDVETKRGRATFELHGLTQDQLSEYLQPLLERTGADEGNPPPD